MQRDRGPGDRTACTPSRSRDDCPPRCSGTSTSATWRPSWSRSSSSSARSRSASSRAGARTAPRHRHVDRRSSWCSAGCSSGKWPHLASAYISGISIGMLVRSPEFWPYALCSAISITSKYVLRVDGRHIWNPSNFGIVAMLVLAVGHRGEPQRAVGQHAAADGGGLGLRRRHHPHARPLPHHADLRGVVPVLRRRAAPRHRPSVPGRGRADHRADVPALHLLHDHRPEDDRARRSGRSAWSPSASRRWRRCCG